MTQPFRMRNKDDGYRPANGPEMMIRLEADAIIITCAKPLETLSSAVVGGGFSKAERIVNWKVPLGYEGSDPVRDFHQMLIERGVPGKATVGLLTAAKLTHASIFETDGDGFSMVCCTTAGTGNAARAGLARPVFSAYEAGTINTVVLIDGQLTSAAMVNAIITATEAKAAALADLGVADHLHHAAATGTTTDAIVIGTCKSERYSGIHRYAGSATMVGSAIGRLVYDTVSEAVSTQKES
ncbi:adenosylcobinamide amidohydrolase [Paenibacillus nasutitermitis]|uniref:Adenosylcobinamide amidohydrolase n=1 Tax=Paenibacillus nasutitermitis TaxID=1652958 RepID=A0A916YYM4_9BACL|nr:adenosylcobinamide amidohydrolase [Paenibacillus nasutitermitis]GGD67531.1 adenosylcobinamide amidohydrolase [Paenibacillus nasutitermitis]